MKQTKTIIYTAILFFAILALFGLKEYLTPKHKFISTTLCSQNGECIDAILSKLMIADEGVPALVIP